MNEQDVRRIAREEAERVLEVYETIDDVPEWAKSTVQKLIDRGLFQEYIGLTYDTLKTLFIIDLLGLY